MRDAARRVITRVKYLAQNLQKRKMDDVRNDSFVLVGEGRETLGAWVVNGNRALLASVLPACYNACVQEDLLSQGSTPFN